MLEKYNNFFPEHISYNREITYKYLLHRTTWEYRHTIFRIAALFGETETNMMWLSEE